MVVPLGKIFTLWILRLVLGYEMRDGWFVYGACLFDLGYTKTSSTSPTVYASFAIYNLVGLTTKQGYCSTHLRIAEPNHDRLRLDDAMVHRPGQQGDWTIVPNKKTLPRRDIERIVTRPDAAFRNPAEDTPRCHAACRIPENSSHDLDELAKKIPQHGNRE